ncbi:MAG: hypothetical protein ACP5UO_05540 [Thermoplasmata archaeon]
MRGKKNSTRGTSDKGEVDTKTGIKSRKYTLTRPSRNKTISETKNRAIEIKGIRNILDMILQSPP